MRRKEDLKSANPPAMVELADAIGHIARNDGDYSTAVSKLTVHRRNALTDPLHCIYRLGLGVVAQGAMPEVGEDFLALVKPSIASPSPLAAHRAMASV